ncbi:MAG: Lrp/AsnC family transcriptional regulator [Firmicutes bacterium]|nr:Lrp/AsnC family transcriptional regulator [Bacillota bacterium]
MDALDQAILGALQQNARASASEISRTVNLSVPAVSERIRKLEQSGVVTWYTARLNRAAAGQGLLAFLLVRIGGTDMAQVFRDEIVRHTCVLECHHVTGAYDYLLKVAVGDVRALESFISGTLKGMRGVKDTNTMISLHTLKEEING